MTKKVTYPSLVDDDFKGDLMEYIERHAQSGDVIQNHIINHLYELFPGDEELTIEEMNKINAFVDDMTQSTVRLFDEVFDKHFLTNQLPYCRLRFKAGFDPEMRVK